MKRLSTMQLVPGMIVADSVLTFDRQLVLNKGTVLTDKLITRLDLYGILTIYVEDNVPNAATETFAPKEPSYSERVKKDPIFQEFKKEYELNVDSFRNVISNVVERNMDMDASALLHQALGMIDMGKGHIGILDMLQNMREYDDSTFAHCVNVGLVCNIFANWLKMDAAQIEMATACGLLHDIGKLMVPYSIISKPGKLSATEENTVRRHPVSGYQLLLTQKVDEHIRNAALMHHERCDGSGYPMQLTASKIDKYARMVAIVDVYDAMTAARVYRGPLCPFRVIEIFETEGFQKYDVEYLLVFLENVVNTYIQCRCQLNDGRIGDIIYSNFALE